MPAKDPFEISALRVLHGQRVEGQPEQLGNIGICRVGGERGTLFVLVDAQGPRRGDIESLLVDTITQSYKRATVSMSGALGAAIREANAVLLAENRTSLRNQQTSAGVYCAVARPGQDLFLAYCGPGVALMLEEGKLDHLPSGSERIPIEPGATAERDVTSSTSLGVLPNIDPRMYNTSFTPGQMLVLGSDSMLDVDLDDEELLNAIGDSGVDGIPDDRDVTALVVSYPLAVTTATREATAAAAVAAAPAGGAGGLAAAGAVIGGRIAGAFRRGAGINTGATAQADAAPAAQAAGAVSAAQAASAVPDWLDDATAQTGQSKQSKRSAGGRPRFRVPLAWIAVLVGVVVLIIAAVTIQGRMEQQALNKKFAALVAQAGDQRTLGQASVDRTQAVTYLQEAESLINQALALKPTDAEALDLIDGIQRDMDTAKGITRLAPSQVTTLANFTAPATSPARIIGDGYNLWVLDKGDQKVYKFVLNPQGNGVQPGGDSVLLRKGDQVGNVVVGDLVEMAWIPQGGDRKTNNLVVLESGGNLVQYDIQRGLSILPVKDASKWRKAQAIGGYSGNFYVMDSLASSILRYRPAGRGYEGTPTEYLQAKVDLTSAVDMAIDGDIFVLMVNGQLQHLSGGRPQPYEIQGLEKPMAAPVAIFTNEGTEGVYTADPTNSRVVKLSKQGEVQKQFVYLDKDGTFSKMRGIFVDEQKQALYLTAGAKLLHVTMPK